MRTPQAKSARPEKTVLFKWGKPLLVGAAIFFLCFFLCIAVLSFLLMNKDLGDSLLVSVACVIIALCAFLGGYIAARISKEKGLLIGGGVGLLCFFLVAIFGALFTQTGFGTIGFVKLLLCLLPAGLGGFFGVNRKKRRK